jgi:hypothetical protein
MILKRNVRQVTLLHVYHHVSIAIIWWMIAHQAPGGDGNEMILILNHVILERNSFNIFQQPYKGSRDITFTFRAVFVLSDSFGFDEGQNVYF